MDADAERVASWGVTLNPPQRRLASVGDESGLRASSGSTLDGGGLTYIDRGLSRRGPSQGVFHEIPPIAGSRFDSPGRTGGEDVWRDHHPGHGEGKADGGGGC